MKKKTKKIECVDTITIKKKIEFYNKKILWIWNGNKKIRLLTIGLYLFDTLLSILMLRKNYNGENKRIINF